MGDLYIKPGNQERGWNDPPQFSYGLQTAQGGKKRNILNKRVPPPQLTGPCPGGPPPVGSSTPPIHPISPPTTETVAPPPMCQRGMATPPLSKPVMAQTDSPDVQSEAEPDVTDVLAQLNWALTACRKAVRTQTCNDVERRLKVFEEMWKEGKLSFPVKRRMMALSRELKSMHWDAADDIHRGLIVDHVNEVSQWMVGVKRLIAETRSLSPENLNADLDQTQNSGSSDSA